MRLGLRRLGISVAVIGTAVGAAACGSSSSKSGAAAPPPATRPPAAVVGPCTKLSGSQAHAGAYLMVATLGPEEAMYTQSDFNKMHPKTGEVMLRGTMNMGGSTSPTTMGSGAGGMGSATTMGMGSTTTGMSGTVAHGSFRAQPAAAMNTTTPMTAAPGATPQMGSPTTMGSTMTTAPMTGSDVLRHLEVHICTVSDGKVVTNANPTITMQDADKSGAMATKVPVAVMEGIGQGTADLHYGNNVTAAEGHHYVVVVTLSGASGRFSLTG